MILEYCRTLAELLGIDFSDIYTKSTDADEDVDLNPDRADAEVIDTMALNLPKHVFPPVFEFASVNIQNANPKYREASVTALGVISEGCLDFMKDKMEPVLHVTLGALRDPEQVVRGAASFALGQFAEHLQHEIGSVAWFKRSSICAHSAIGSVASAAEQAFIPYAERVLELMKSFMVLTNDEDLRSRARATELVGMVAMAVGRTRMEPILAPFMEAAISGFGLDFSELREYTHGFFSNVAEILDDGFTQYLPHVVPLVFSSCNLDDGSAVDIDEPDDEYDNGFGGASSDDEAHDEPRVRNISVRTGVLDENAAATQALGFFALHTKSSYALDILTAGYAIFQSHNDGPAKAREVLDSVMHIYLKTMTEDDDKEVFAQACVSVADSIKDFGYVAVEPYISQLVDATLVLLKEESACQQSDNDSDIDDADDIEHDEVLMDAVSDILPAFAKSMGVHFAPIFAKLFEPLMEFAELTPSTRSNNGCCMPC
ncbi:ARM repeat superfamily protein [Euphorbia peplus]|nr:ARM repeat superfamily protein [Euphorbia peplus]